STHQPRDDARGIPIPVGSSDLVPIGRDRVRCPAIRTCQIHRARPAAQAAITPQNLAGILLTRLAYVRLHATVLRASPTRIGVLAIAIGAVPANSRCTLRRRLGSCIPARARHLMSLAIGVVATVALWLLCVSRRRYESDN